MSDLEELIQKVRSRAALPDPVTRRAIREAAGVTRQEVAEVVGVTRQAIAYWETGDRSPGPGHRERYAEVLRRLALVPA